MFIDGDFFEKIADISFGDTYTNMIQPNSDIIINLLKDINRIPILYIDSSRLLNLFVVISSINSEFIIISHNSDLTFNDSLINSIPKNVKRLWCQNYNGLYNEVIKPLPIGLERKIWFTDQKKQDVIDNNSNLIRVKVDTFRNVYMNFSTQTNTIRNKWYDFLKDKDFIHTEMLGNGNDYNYYISKLVKYKFAISPPGNGIDCHRNWECLYLGVIPIIHRSNFTENMFLDMNVVLVDSYKDITKELLDNYEGSTFSEKLSTEYWEKIIKEDVK